MARTSTVKWNEWRCTTETDTEEKKEEHLSRRLKTLCMIRVPRKHFRIYVCIFVCFQHISPRRTSLYKSQIRLYHEEKIPSPTPITPIQPLPHPTPYPSVYFHTVRSAQDSYGKALIYFGTPKLPTWLCFIIVEMETALARIKDTKRELTSTNIAGSNSLINNKWHWVNL